MLQILTIIGARPQIIKAAALSRAVKNSFSDEIEEKILHTGQHYDKNMSEVFFDEMGIPRPDFNLNIGSGRHGEQTAKMIIGIEQILENKNFNAVILFGDTNSTLAGAVAASKIHIPIVHIEAGLRSFNMAMPEEINRIVCDNLSTLLFAPTETAVKNLVNDGFCTSKATFENGKQRQVFNSGDIMYDNSLFFAEIAEQKTDIIQRLNIQNQNFILTTIHRDNNTDDSKRLTSIIEALIEIADRGCKIVLPLHPRTKKLLPQNLLPKIYDKLLNNNNIIIIPPTSFFEIIALEKQAKMIMTDSGGVQKEAYFFQKPCIILRAETEWVEIIEQGAGIIANADKTLIINAFNDLYNKKIIFPRVFGNGKSSEFICKKIIENI